MNDSFFIAGAQRSGTTYLCHLLDEHPEIELATPLSPEPKFFFRDDLFKLGREYYEKNYFQGKPSARIRGEKSVCYMESETSASRIAQVYPAAKIIFLLRNPIDRAISNYRFSLQNGFESLPMDHAFYQEGERIKNFDPQKISVSPFAYLSRGKYIDYIPVFENYFSQENILIVLLEKLLDKPENLKNIYGFLGVNPDFTPSSLNKIVNSSLGNNEKISKELLEYLKFYFSVANEKLRERYGLDTAIWRDALGRMGLELD